MSNTRVAYLAVLIIIIGFVLTIRFLMESIHTAHWAK